ncbi:hypothetical protein [Rufibacter hautae]|uniref:Macroglobulin domain-containing protein n=1 Tax=Rufibacter hautae TaxID=2595005 RepID=A0A5B6TJI0_9BACT|nr:hypothetical protein [Rufibacter hautae]KAA3439539.1 hypothetical protein FOA19_02300 [Rufibacter hautae]
MAFTWRSGSWKGILAQREGEEQVHVRFSQPYYASGDTVRFKAYVFAAASLQPTFQSQILEIEFKTTVPGTTQHLRFPITQGMATGSFVLPDTLSRGQYAVIAYTPAMIPGGKKDAFQTRLRVLGPATAKAKVDPESLNKPTAVNLQAFPEGGKLVAQVENRLAIKATNQEGNGVATKGRIMGAAGAATVFQTNQEGVALVQFTPQEGQQYQMVLENRNTTAVLRESKFPAVEAQGISLRMQPQTDSALHVRLLPNSTWIQKRGDKRVQVKVLAEGKTVLTAEEKLNRAEGAEIMIPVHRLPAGLLTFTVANADGQVEAQRFVLVQHPRQLRIQLKTDRIRYGRREPVRVTALVTDAAGKPVDASLAFAVRPRAQSQELYASSLEREIFQGVAPRQGLTKALAPAVDSTLEGALLAQTPFRNFVAGPAQQAQPDTALTLSIAGKVVDDKGAPVPTTTLLMFGRGSTEPMLQTPGPDGNFVFQSPDFVSPDQFTFEVLRSGERVKDANLVWTNLPSFAKTPVLPLVLTEPEAQYLRQTALRKQATALFGVKGGIAQEKDSTDALLEELGTPDQSFDMSQYVTFKDLAEVIKETIPLASVVENDKGRSIRIFSPERSGARYKEHPLYFLDGVPTLNNDWILQLPGTAIKKIDLFYAQRKLRNLGMIARHGVLSITTNAPHPSPREFQNNQTLAWAGMAPLHAFKTPSYEYNTPSPAPDLRSMLFWAPSVATDAKGQGTISFYTSDDIGEFEVEVEAYTKNGFLGTQNLRFSITPNL